MWTLIYVDGPSREKKGRFDKEKEESPEIRLVEN